MMTRFFDLHQATGSRRRLGRAPLAVALVSLLVLASAVFLLGRPGVARADGPELGIDTDTTGNTATEVQAVDACREASVGDTLRVDIYIKDVEDLNAWESLLQYDGSIVNVTGRDVELFLGSEPGSNIFDASQSTPDIDGRYSVGAVNTADPLVSVTGSGVLARMTLEVVGEGVSELSLEQQDFDGDDSPDRGVVLKDTGGESIGDDNDDSLFDGDTRPGFIAVGTVCADVDVPSNDDDDVPLWAIIAGVAAAVVLLIAATGAVLMRRRRPRAP